MAQQEAKFCELENNKEKFAAAKKRLEILKKVCKPISDNLLLGDLLWVSLDTEMETMKNILENVSVAYYEEENKQCARNLVMEYDGMRNNYFVSLNNGLMFYSKFLRKYRQILRRI